MNRGIAHDERLVDKTVTIPALLVVTRLWQRDGPLDESSQGIRLRQRLTIELVNPLRRTICRDHDQRPMLIPSFRNGRSKIQKGCARSDADDYRLFESLRHSQGIEARRAFISNGITGDIRTCRQIMHNRRITTAWADDGMTNAMSYEQCRQDVYMIFVAIHLLIVSSLASVSCHSCSSVLPFKSPPPA